MRDAAVPSTRVRSATPLAGAPSVGQVAVALGEHRYDQRTLSERLRRRWKDQPKASALIDRLHGALRVEERCLALPIDEYDRLTDFGAANDAFIRVGTELAARAVRSAVERAQLELEHLDAIFFTTVTGIAAPTVDARLVNALGLRRDIRRTPMFGLGCVGGAAALARASDYLVGHAGHSAVVVAVELCSLTLQNDVSIANVLAAGLFGDGAAAGGVCGDDCAPAGARVLATRSAFFPDTERVMGWDVGATGFKVVLSAEVPSIVRTYVASEVDALLGEQGLTRDDVRHWICHPGGPKVISAMEEALGLSTAALDITRESLASIGNLSSASVLDVLGKTQRRARPGDIGLLIAMGPGFCAELVLLRW